MRSPDVAAARELGAAIAANQRAGYKEALPRARAAAAAFESRGNRAGMLRARAEQAYALHFLRDTAGCAAAAAAVIGESARYPWIGIQARIEGAVCAAFAGRTGHALELLEEASALARAHRYDEIGLRASGILTEQHFLLGDARAPWIEGSRDLKLYWRSASRPNRGHQIVFNQALAAEAAGLDHAALLLRESAAREIHRAGNPLVEMSAHLLVARSAIRARDQERTRRAIEQAARLSDGTASGQRRHSLLDLASAFLDAGDHDGARRHLEESGRLRAENEPGITRSTEQEIAGRLALHDGSIEAARRAFEQARDIERKRFEGKPGAATDSRLAEIERRLLDVAARASDPPARSLAAWDSFQSGFGFDPAAALAQLDGEAFVSFAPGESAIHAFLADRDGIVYRQVRKDESLEATVTQLPRLCASPESPRDRVTRVARSGYDALLAPFGERIARARRLVIATDGPLAAIPFAALEPPGGVPVGIAKEIARVESLGQYLRRSALPGAAEGSRALAVVNPRLGPALERIFPPIVERPNLDAARARWATAVLSGDAARLSALERGVRGASLFLFWGHGARRAGRASLLLASGADERSESADASRIDATAWRSCRLAILAACSSGGSAAGGGIESLVMSLLRAGVRNVVATRWDVHAGASADLVNSFLAAAAKGENAAAALRRAMASARGKKAMGEDRSHPYYWAAFENFGAP